MQQDVLFIESFQLLLFAVYEDITADPCCCFSVFSAVIQTDGHVSATFLSQHVTYFSNIHFIVFLPFKPWFS
jgi:hypothetical protein